jgi:hypothetical protein
MNKTLSVVAGLLITGVLVSATTPLDAATPVTSGTIEAGPRGSLLTPVGMCKPRCTKRQVTPSCVREFCVRRNCSYDWRLSCDNGDRSVGGGCCVPW